MTTPQERQRVGRELRTYRGAQYMETFARHMDGIFCYSGQESFKEVAHDLAEYIDPTCHAELVTVELPDCIGGYVECSECHAVWREPSRVSYCPNCGARRVFDDGVAYSMGGDDDKD